MKALVLDPDRSLHLRDVDIQEKLGPRDVRIDIHTVGICGSDVHYFVHGRIGDFVVRKPMILGHEASGVVTEVGSEVSNLAVGDRVCMEPGVPRFDSRPTLEGRYNLDPDVQFWATPPVHGVLRPSVVHPAAFTFRLPEEVSHAEGAMVEPLAVGMQAVVKAKIRPGDCAVVLGAGPIGILNALAALAGGCAKVVLTDIDQSKLDVAAGLGQIVTVNAAREDVAARVREITGGWGADVVFEASGAVAAADQAVHLAAPGGVVVFVGIPEKPIAFDIAAAQLREVRTESVFRYANMFPRAIELLASRRIDVRPLVTDVYAFEDSVEAFIRAREMPAGSVKMQIELAGSGI